MITAAQRAMYRHQYRFRSGFPAIEELNWQASGRWIVYVVQSQQRGGAIKIGFTGDVLSRRVSGLRVAEKDRTIELVAYIQASEVLEGWMHIHFADKNIEREWFQPCAEINDFIKSLGFTIVREMIVAPLYRELSDYGAGAIVTFTTPAGNTHEGIVDELELDSDGAWLYIRYQTENAYGRKLNMNVSLTIGDVALIKPAPKQTATPVCTSIAAHS